MRTDVVLGCRKNFVPAAVSRLASDERLVEQVHAGSERAFEVIFDRHHGPLLAFCRHMLRSREEAEDVVQLTFLAAYRDLVRAQPPFALRPWLYAIARHRCLSVLRARRERPVVETPEPATHDLTAEIATREELRAMLVDVARLPDDQRAALVLAELGDVSHEEIGRILACPRTKVKALVFQARSSLAHARAARETPCAEIREQLTTLYGGALLRAPLRRHLHDCPGCRAFREQLRTQRRALRLLLPVAPAVGLKRAVLGAVFGPGGAGGAVTTGGLSAGGVTATALVALALPAGGITAAVSASRHSGVTAHTIAAAAQIAATASALPGRAGAGQFPAERHRVRARSSPRSGGKRVAQIVASGIGGDESVRADSPGQAESAVPAEAATPPEAPGAGGQVSTATPTDPTNPPEAVKRVEWPSADGLAAPPAPAGPAEPTEPPDANGEPAATGPAESDTAPEAGRPAEPPSADAQLTPAALVDSAMAAEAATVAAPPSAGGQVRTATPTESSKPSEAVKPAERPSASGPAALPGPGTASSKAPEVVKPAESPSASGPAAPPGLPEGTEPPKGGGQSTAAKPDAAGKPPQAGKPAAPPKGGGQSTAAKPDAAGKPSQVGKAA